RLPRRNAVRATRPPLHSRSQRRAGPHPPAPGGRRVPGVLHRRAAALDGGRVRLPGRGAGAAGASSARRRAAVNVRRVAAVAAKEWREIRRDRIYFALAFLLPAMLMVVFGHGMSQDVENVSFALLDEDRSALSRDYARHFIDSRYFAFKGALR